MVFKRLILAGLVFTLMMCIPAAYAQDTTKHGKAAYAFDEAIQYYLKGDSQKSIQLLNDSLKLDPENQKAKVFLLKILVERGSRLFLAKKYKKAYTYLAQAYNMDQNNQQVKQMYQLAAKQLQPRDKNGNMMIIPQEMQEEMLKQQAQSQTVAQGGANVKLNKPKKMVKTASGKMVEVEVDDADPVLGSANQTQAYVGSGGGTNASAAQMASVFAGEYAKNVSAMSELLMSFQQQQATQVSQFIAPLERIQNLYYESEKDRKNFMNQLDSRFKNVMGDVSFQQRMVIYGFIGSFLILGLIVWGFFLILGRMRSKREETIMKYQQEMLKMVRDMSGMPGNPYSALPPGGGYGMPAYGQQLPGAQMGQPQLTANPQMGGMQQPMQPDPAMQLEQMTKSGNYKERSLAAVKLLALDAERAMDIIKQMITDSDPFQRESMAFALGEQYHPLTLEFIIDCLQDNEKRVAAAAARALKRIQQQPEEIVPVEAQEEIQKALGPVTPKNKSKSTGKSKKAKG